MAVLRNLPLSPQGIGCVPSQRCRSLVRMGIAANGRQERPTACDDNDAVFLMQLFVERLRNVQMPLRDWSTAVLYTLGMAC